MSENPADKSELGRAVYTAGWAPGVVVITAVGYTSTTGYRVWLQQSPIDVYPPQYELRWIAPSGPSGPSEIPFKVNASFRAPDPVRRVTVVDAAGTHEVNVAGGEGRKVDAAADHVPANYFQVSATRTLVTYSATDLGGQPRLTYNRRAFGGGELQIAKSPIGQLVTVTLESSPDRGTTSFTLVVPRVTVAPGSVAPVRLLGITATEHMTIAGPPPGQNIEYRVEEFAGEAMVILT